MAEAERREPDAALQTRIVLRPIGLPLPLGMSALAMGSFIVTAQELGWLGSAGSLQTGLFLLGLVFPLQLISALLGFLDRDPVAGTAMAVTSAGWLVQGLSKVVPQPDPHFAGLALLVVAAAIAVACISSWFGNAAAALVLTFTVVRFVLSALHGLTGAEGLEDAAGVVGLLVTALALYLALATELERIRTAPDLPLLRRGAAWENRRDGFPGQLAHIEQEPGVRRQL